MRKEEMIPFNELKRGFNLYKEEYEQKALEVLNSGWYILGQEVDSFERELAGKLGGGFCASVDNGLDAIVLGIRALGIGKGDEVIVQSNAYIATVMGVSMNDAVPVFVEPNKFYNINPNEIEKKISKRTRAVLVTHLYGQPSEMERISDICSRYGIHLLEDCAQSHFATYNGKMTGRFGTMGFFSFFPTKNLGGFGDGGAVVSENEELIAKIKTLRNYGSNQKYYNEIIGYNARLDEIQAGLLRVKLSHIEELNQNRRRVAERYLGGIKNPLVMLPSVAERAESVWHLFVVRVQQRDDFRKYLAEQGVESEIHYPIPVHLSEAYSSMGYRTGDFPIAEEYAKTVVSLPLMDNMTDMEIEKVIEVVNSYGK